MARKFSKNSTTMVSAVLVKPSNQTAPGTGVNGIPANIGMTQVFNSETKQYENVDAYLELQGSDGGLLFNRMTTDQMYALKAVNGMKVYVTDVKPPSAYPGFWSYVDGGWLQDGSGGGGGGSVNSVTAKYPTNQMDVTTNVNGDVKVSIKPNPVFEGSVSTYTNDPVNSPAQFVANSSTAPQLSKKKELKLGATPTTASFYSYNGDFQTASGNLLTDQGDIRTSLGNIKTANGNIEATTGTVSGTALPGHSAIIATSGDVQATLGKVVAGGDIIAGGSVTAGTGITVTSGNLNLVNGNINITNGGLNLPSSSAVITNKIESTTDTGTVTIGASSGNNTINLKGTVQVNGAPIAAAGTVTGVLGTVNQVSVTNSSTTPTVSLPNNLIAPGFITATTNLSTVNGAITAGGANGDLFVNQQATITNSDGVGTALSITQGAIEFSSSNGTNTIGTVDGKLVVQNATTNANTVINLGNGTGTSSIVPSSGAINIGGNIFSSGNVIANTFFANTALNSNTVTPLIPTGTLVLGSFTGTTNLIGNVQINGSPISSGGVSNVSGTTNQITVTNGSTNAVISLPNVLNAPGSLSAASTITAGTNISTTNGAISAGGANGDIVANKAIQAGTTITAGTGINVATGNVTISSGSLNLSNGNINLAPTGNISVSSIQPTNPIGTINIGGATNTVNLVGTVQVNGSPIAAGGSVTSVATGTGLTGGPITTSGTIALANTTVTSGSYTNTNISVDAQGRIISASNGSIGVTSVTGTANQITVAGTATVPVLSLPSTLNAPGGITAATGLTVTTGDVSIPSGSINLPNGDIIATSDSHAIYAMRLYAPTSTGNLIIGQPNSSTKLYGSVSVNDAPLPTGTVTSVTAGTGLTGGSITGSGTIGLANTTVTAGSYVNPSVTIDAQGRITSATSGGTPVTSVTGTAGNITVIGTTTPVIDLPNTSVTAGTYTNTNITVDAKGRITAAANGSSTSGVASVTGTTNQITVGGTATNPVLSLPSTVNAPGSLSASSGITAGNGLTVTTGGISAANSALSVSSINVNGTGVIQTLVANVTSGNASNIIVAGSAQNPTVNLVATGTAQTIQPGVITTDAFGRVTSSAARGMIILKTVGTGTLSGLPSGTINAKVTVVGGGGNGGTSVQNSTGAGGGAGGSVVAYVPVSNGITYTVGAAQTASTFNSGTSLITANAGGTAPNATSATQGVIGGVGGGFSVGSAITIFTGFNGGGGGAGSGGGGIGSSFAIPSGAGGNSIFGGGANSVCGGVSLVNGTNGAPNTGGGGSGPYSNGSIGTGGTGVIIIEW